MGYSAAITCKSKKAQEEMWSFMGKHYRDVSLVLQFKQRARYEGLVHSEGIKYGHGPLNLGFNSPGDYEFALLRWMALRVGKRRVFKTKGINRAVPWVNCDNQGSEPVLLRSEWPNPSEQVEMEAVLVDEHGYAPKERWWLDDYERAAQMEGEYSRRDNLIQAEQERLSELWISREL